MKRPWSPWRNEPYWNEYSHQRANADRRKIEWKLTYPEWWSIWEKSGCWDERGRGSDRYCMARFGDIGPYALGNVMIITNRENRAMAKPCVHTEEFKEDLSLRNTGNTYAKSQRGKKSDKWLQAMGSKETREKVGQASINWWRTASAEEKAARNQKISEKLQGHPPFYRRKT